MRLAVLFFAASAALGCESTNTAYCDEQTPCTDSTRGFCDLAGVYQEIGKTCIERPAEVCDTSAECQESIAPICGGIEKTGATGRTAVVNECRACAAGSAGDTECAARGDDGAICENGACVECRVSADCMNPDRPVCNESSNTCLGCVANSDCASDVCEVEEGRCLDVADVVYVNAASGLDSVACGTQTMECQTIMGPMGGLAKVNATRKTLRLRGAMVFSESVAVIAGQTVSFVGPATVNAGGNNEPVFDIDNSSDVSLIEITASLANGNADADGIICAGSSTLTVRQSSIDNNDATGVEASTCNLRIDRSTISQNAQGGLNISNSDFEIVNNFIVSNGTAGGAGASAVGGIAISTAQTTDILEFNTIADSRVANVGVDGAGARCTNAPITSRNNIVWGRTGGNSLVSNCEFTFSDVEGSVPGTGNIDIDPLFINEGLGNFHLQANSPARNVADPASTVRVDFDGDRRPQDARSDMGADEVLP